MAVETRYFDSGSLGTRLVVFGAIHGNEHCGPKGIERVISRIEKKDVSLVAGSVRFVPVCNLEAFKRNARQYEENLNRIFRKTESPRSYEAKRANELCALLEREADMLIDLHSTSAPGPMSVFTDHPSPVSDALARSLGPAFIILDWPLVYADDPFGYKTACTSDFAHSLGIPSATVECGQHEDPASIDAAEKAILRAMAFAGIIAADAGRLPEPRFIRMTKLFKKDSEGDVFAKRWEHLEAIPAGTKIATREGGSTIDAEVDLVMILPKHRAKPGEEWFYTGVET